MHSTNFKKMVKEYKNLIFSQALYSTGSRNDAADITQEVLIKLWNNMDNIQAQTLKSWLFTVTRNCCIDIKRKKHEQYFSELSADDEQNAIDQISADPEADPEHSLDKHESQQRIISAIAGLPEKIRTSIIMRYIHDEAYETIAHTLGLPINSIKVYLHRGHKILAKKLRETTGNKREY
jgi:RNA polymerase sigma-70 factor, ECF subfamily